MTVEAQTILSVDVIRMDGGTQPRAELNQAHLEELVEVLNEGHTFKDPVVVFYDGTDYWLADGFHRVNATKQTECVAIHADVRSGTLEDAIAYSCGANATHGLRRTNEDKRRAVNRLLTLPQWLDKSNREVARQCEVTEHLVRIIRSELPDDHPAATKSQMARKQPVEPIQEPEEVRIRTADIDAEKRSKVEQFFDDYPTLTHLSNREIARRCEVTEGLVRKVRKEIEDRQEVVPELIIFESTQAEEPTPEIENIPEPEAKQPESVVPETNYATVDDLFPGFTAWQQEQQSLTEPEPATSIETIEDIYEDDHEDEEPNADPAIPAIVPSPTPEPVPMPTSAHVLIEEQPEEDTEEKAILDQKVAESLAQMQKDREIKREQKKEQISQLKEKGVELPSGKYSCLVVDPPWTMQKIEREERPNQMEFDYPTMTEEELKAFPLPEVAADNCHLYLWTTQKHLPLALRLAEHWGFKYQCIMTWVKNVGFTPFSWMYSTEHVLFCTKGSLPLLEKGRRLDFGGKVREHSRKPDTFYNLVTEVSPGPRLDIFSREKREGFDQYGNEVEKYASA